MQTDFLLSGKIKKTAIAYYRHSAEDKQENSVPIQRELTEKFAQEHGIEIIHEEADEGETGLLANRPGFTNLFEHWILKEDAPVFDYVFVYDVSRWGRFQDQDEAAYYEFRCKQRGKKVIYVSKGFPKAEQQLIAHLQTSIERYMAAEYSRQLSGKVFNGCIKVSQQGYSAGGMPCYGMGRQLLDVNRKPIRILKKGEHKQIANERVTFVPLDDDTTQAVRDIFHLFVIDKLDLGDIAKTLNDRDIPSASGGLWNREKIAKILTNETYAGTRLYNKTWNRLRQGTRDNPRSEWVICKDAFPGIVSKALFEQTQDRLWFELEKWREGEWAIQRAKALFRRKMKLFLRNKGFSDDDIFYICYDFPLVFSVSSIPSSSAQEWCFLLPENMGWQDAVLGIGVVPEHSNPVDQFFLIPTGDFSVGRVCTFKNTDQQYGRYTLPSDALEQTVLSLVQSDFMAINTTEEVAVAAL